MLKKKPLEKNLWKNALKKKKLVKNNNNFWKKSPCEKKKA